MTPLEEVIQLAKELEEANELMGMGLTDLLMLLEEMEPTDPPDDPPDPPTEPPPVEEGIWIGANEIMALPMNGKAWENVLAAANTAVTTPNLLNQDSQDDTTTLAKTLVYARVDDGVNYLGDVVEILEKLMQTDLTSSKVNILAIVRNITGYVLAADIIGLGELDPELDKVFMEWLDVLRHITFTGGVDHSIISCHEERPNNFGTHAGAARIAIALYLGDTAELERAAAVFKGWLGDRDSYTGFKFGELSWQADQQNPVGINPKGATRDGHPIGGVLPDDQRRGGSFTWPPPKENYVWEALQGACVQAELLTRAGYPAWEWCNRALLRAVKWLHEEANYPATGDDTGTPWLVNHAYGADAGFPAESPTSPGKGMGFTDWTHAN